MRLPTLRSRAALPLVAAFFVGPIDIAPHSAPAAPLAQSLAEPSLSPDHREIAFVSGGDIWTVPYGGGEARLLVSHPATESRPVYSPDGTQLAFVSNRTGNGDVYVLTLATGDTRRITWDDALGRIAKKIKASNPKRFSSRPHSFNTPRPRQGERVAQA